MQTSMPLFMLVLAAGCQGRQPAPPIQGLAETPPLRSAVLWQGFRHEWTYNHRLNRLGSWVEVDRCMDGACEGRARHSGASGSGTDTWVSYDRYLHVSSEVAEFTSHAMRLTVTGDEETVVTMPFSRTVSTGRHMDGPVVPLLQGFDLTARGPAKKLGQVEIRLLEQERSHGQVTVNGEVRLWLDCDSAECPLDRDRWEYQVDVYLMTIAYPEGAGRHTPLEVSRTTAWEDPTRSQLTGTYEGIASWHRETRSLPAADRGRIIGITGFAVDLRTPDDELSEYHLLGLAGAVDQVTSETATVELDVVNWVDGMRSARPISSVFAFGDAANASMSLELVDVRLDRTCVVQNGWMGTALWQAGPDPSSAAATAFQDVRFDGLACVDGASGPTRDMEIPVRLRDTVWAADRATCEAEAAEHLTHADGPGEDLCGTRCPASCSAVGMQAGDWSAGTCAQVNGDDLLGEWVGVLELDATCRCVCEGPTR